jgi:hypothetical protein
MSTLIKRWDIVLQTKDALEADIPPEVVGSQWDKEPDIRSGFLIITKGHNIHAVPLERVHYFGIIAVKDDEQDTHDYPLNVQR